MITYREVRKKLREEGWTVRRQSGSHEQWYHPDGRGPVTIAGKDKDGIPQGTWKSIQQQARWRERDLVWPQVKEGKDKTMIRVNVVVERAVENQQVVNYSVFAPDWPGCIAAGETIDEALNAMRTALAWHLSAILKDEIEPTSIMMEMVAADE